MRKMFRRLARALRWSMRNRRLVLFALIVIMIAILASCWGLEGGDAIMAAAGFVIAPGTDDGKHVVDGPLTTDATNDVAPDLLLNEIDQQIVKIRPMSTPLDQISRYAGARHSGSMIVDYYNVDTKVTSTTLEKDFSDSEPESTTARIYPADDSIFDATDTILVQGVTGYESDHQTESDCDLVLYVVSRDTTNGLQVMAINGMEQGGVTNSVPDIPAGTTLIRMGRAASELDVMSPQFEALPKKSTNFCQIFKMQVEQSTLQKLANKEVNWTMSDQEEAAIYDMRLGMEKSFLFGVKSRLWDETKKEHITFTGGIWNQAGKTFHYNGTSLSASEVIEMMRQAFTGNAGSRRKIMLGGSKLIGLISQLDYNRVISAGESVSKWGIDFTELRSKFGTLYLLLSEIFDECGMESNGLIIDPEYIQKYSHVPFSAEALDLKASGMRNTDALVMSEASCLVLRYPKAHMRIIAN